MNNYDKFIERNLRFSVSIPKESGILKMVKSKNESLNISVRRALNNEFLAQQITGLSVFDLIMYYQNNKRK